MSTGTPQRLTPYPPGSTIEQRPDGRVFVWYPPALRVVVRFVAPDTCPMCGCSSSDTGVCYEELRY